MTPRPPRLSSADTSIETVGEPALTEAGLFRALHPELATWFRGRFGSFSPAQRFALPEILSGNSTLLSSPTGSGKTLAAFLGVFDYLRQARERDALPTGIVAIYVSPLRALAYDLQKNLQTPLDELGWSWLKVGARTGDTSPKDRAAMKRRPPHILVTTPESLTLLLSQPDWIPAFLGVRFLVADELHALAENKRGAMLMASAERLEDARRRSWKPHAAPADSGGEATPIGGERIANDTAPALIRIGLSATVSPLATVAQFLVGPTRRCRVIEVSQKKPARIEVFSPLRQSPYPPAGYTATRVLKELGQLLVQKRTTLIFTNTRSGAEGIGLRLKQLLPKLAARIEVHHASLDRAVRLDVEDKLKRGELRAVVCSTSLEMGIDIGTIDTVVMVSAPKGIARALQRIGRSGHSMGETSHGVLVATNINDLAECTVTARMMEGRRLEPVKFTRNPLDVLAQQLVGLAVFGSVTTDEAFDLMRRSHPFHDLPRESFDRVVRYLEGGGRSLEKNYRAIFGKIRVDGSGRLTLSAPRVARDFYQNIGTIASESTITVQLGRKPLGQVEESFMKGMRPGDVFVLNGRTVRLVETRLLTAKVTPANSSLPTVPRWNANKMPLASGLADEVVTLRTEAAQLLGRIFDSPPIGPGETLPPDPPSAKGGPALAAMPGIAPLHPPIGGMPIASKPGAAVKSSRAPAPLGNDLEARLSQRRTQEALNALVDFLRTDYRLTHDNAIALGRHFLLQRQVSAIPTREFFLVESYRERDVWNYFFHSLIGRSANDALSRIVAQRVQATRGGNALVTIDDYGFLLSLRHFQASDRVEDWRPLFGRNGAERDLRLALEDSSLVKWQFRGTAQTGLMVPRRVRGEERGARSLQWSSEIIFDVLRRHEPDHPLLTEAYEEATLRFLDLPRALEFLDRASSLPWDLRSVGRVSPFSFGIYVSKIKETMMLEDPETTIERLYHEMYGRDTLSIPATPE